MAISEVFVHKIHSNLPLFVLKKTNKHKFIILRSHQKDHIAEGSIQTNEMNKYEHIKIKHMTSNTEVDLQETSSKSMYFYKTEIYCTTLCSFRYQNLSQF